MLHALVCIAMRQYRPTIEQLKKRYSRDMARRKMIAQRHLVNPDLALRPKIPDNSEPWLPYLPRTVEECAWISGQIAESTALWKKEFPKVFSSAG